MATIRFAIPGTPRGKKSARSGRFVQRHFTDEKTADEMIVFRRCAYDAMRGLAPFEGAVEVTLCAYMAIRPSWPKQRQAAARAGRLRPHMVKPDWDNFAKMCDALKGVVWRDDCQVTDGHLFKRYTDEPRIVIEVSEIEGLSDG